MGKTGDSEIWKKRVAALSRTYIIHHLPSADNDYVFPLSIYSLLIIKNDRKITESESNKRKIKLTHNVH